MTLRENLSEHVRACFAGIWISSHEHDDALADIDAVCREGGWNLLTWDCDRGLTLRYVDGHAGNGADGNTDPLPAIKALATVGGDSAGKQTLLVLRNLHRFLDNAEVMQAVANAIVAGKQLRTFIVVLAPVVRVPVELEKLFAVLEHELPDSDQLLEVAKSIATEDGELPEADDALQRILDASAGLTRYEAEAAYSLAIIRHGRIEPSTIWELKAGMLKKSGLLDLHRGEERFDDLGGLSSLKGFCRKALAAKSNASKIARPRGVLLLGVPGTGKSAFAKALGNETERPTLTLDIGALMGGLVGETEENVRRALAIADAMAPCILFVDEVEKGLAGSTGASTDSGVSARLFGTLLTWLNDHTTDVFVVCTANDVSKLPPEFSRAERFDGIFFLDLPGEDDRGAIWGQYVEKFQVPFDSRISLPADDGWTGAEIKACCRLAALLDVPLNEAAMNVVPVSRTAGDKIAALRQWADGRCLDANKPGIFTRTDVASTVQTTARRNITRPSTN